MLYPLTIVKVWQGSTTENRSILNEQACIYKKENFVKSFWLAFEIPFLLTVLLDLKCRYT